MTTEMRRAMGYLDSLIKNLTISSKPAKIADLDKPITKSKTITTVTITSEPIPWGCNEPTVSK